MKRFIHTYSIASVFMLAFLFSCEDDRYEPATITFYPALHGEGVEPEEGFPGTAFTVKLVTSRRLIEESQINIRIEGNGGGYGSSYTTSPPQLEPGIVTLTIPRGEMEASFTFIPRNDDYFEYTDYAYTFSIAETSNSIKSIGQKKFSMKVKDNTLPIVDTDFTDCPGDFSEHIVTGSSTWACSGFGYPDEAQANKCLEANAFNKGGTLSCNTYMILNDPIDGNEYSLLYINAQVYSRFTGNGGIKFVYSANYPGTGNPEGFLDAEEEDPIVWTEFSEINAALPAAGTQAWTSVAQLLKDVPNAPIYIAIQHQGGTTASSSSWRIDNVIIKGN
jgi:hypothetical protein